MSAVGPGERGCLDLVHVADRHELRVWLQKHHLTSPGMWLRTDRPGTGRPRPGIDEIVEELLCFGWIDSTMRKLDETQTELRCTPRRPGSQWSKRNKERVERLTRSGLMQPRGLEAVAIARRSGAWDCLNDVENLVEPADLTSVLDVSPAVRRNWNDSPASYRRGILHWILSAKRPGTRLSRIETAVAAAAENRRVGGPAGSAQTRVEQANTGPGKSVAIGDPLTPRETRVTPGRSRPSPERGGDA